MAPCLHLGSGGRVSDRLPGVWPRASKWAHTELVAEHPALLGRLPRGDLSSSRVRSAVTLRVSDLLTRQVSEGPAGAWPGRLAPLPAWPGGECGRSIAASGSPGREDTRPRTSSRRAWHRGACHAPPGPPTAPEFPGAARLLGGPFTRPGPRYKPKESGA